MCWLSIVDDIQGAVLKIDKDEHDNGLLMKAQREGLPVIVQHKTAVAAWSNMQRSRSYWR